MNIVVANSNPIHKNIEQKCVNELGATLITVREDLSTQTLKRVNPEYVFFLHWSLIIPKEIWSKYKCIVFHMTDLPYGRGGSPLQNLIVRNHSETKISALLVDEGLDTGKIFLKRGLSLYGTAEEIFLRAGIVMYEMIVEIISNPIIPKAQEGKAEVFKRRTPTESNISNLTELAEVYNFIRMLDSKGYPKAYIETEFFKFEFSRASLKSDGILADVKIIKKI